MQTLVWQQESSFYEKQFFFFPFGSAVSTVVTKRVTSVMVRQPAVLTEDLCGFSHYLQAIYGIGPSNRQIGH